MNNVVLAGRLVADPELNSTNTGIEVVNFRIAVDQSYAKAGEERKADFFNVVAWRKAAAFIAQYFKKGDGIVLNGKLQARTYETDSKEKRYIVEVVADNVEFPLSNKSRTSNVPVQNDTAPTTVPQDNNTASKMDELNQMTDEAPTPEDDDLPF